MKVISDHLKLLNPRYRCQSGKDEIVVPVSNTAGVQASFQQLKQLRRIAGVEYEYLEPLYSQFDGIVFHESKDTAGIIVAKISELEEMNSELKEWLDMMEPEDLCEYQREGVAFATIESSGNYFVLYQGKVFYSVHDDLEEDAYADSLEEFFERALNDPAKFLYDAGCYTRYSDGKSDRQFIPKAFIHD